MKEGSWVPEGPAASIAMGEMGRDDERREEKRREKEEGAGCSAHGRPMVAASPSLRGPIKAKGSSLPFPTSDLHPYHHPSRPHVTVARHKLFVF